METVEICVDSDLLEQVRLVLRPYGLTPEDAIVLFLIDYSCLFSTRNTDITSNNAKSLFEFYF